MHVSMRVFIKADPQGPWLFLLAVEADVSEDLPSHITGPILTEALRQAYNLGYSPKDVKIIVQFT